MQELLIMIDLDGTTLNDEKTIHPLTKEAIKKVISLGHKVVISTGRPYYNSYLYYEELALDTLIVNRNGALIHHPKEGKEIYSVNISIEIIDTIVNSSIISSIVHFYVEDKNTFYVIKGNMDIFENTRCKFEQVIFSNTFTKAMMFTLFVKNDSVKEVITFLEQFDEIIIDPWYHQGQYPTTRIEVLPKNVNKVNGIKHLCDYYNIPIENTIAIGDGANDIEMIKTVNLGVAMKNANENLKEHADMILDYSNNEGGVGIFLTSYFSL